MKSYLVGFGDVEGVPRKVANDRSPAVATLHVDEAGGVGRHTLVGFDVSRCQPVMRYLHPHLRQLLQPCADSKSNVVPHPPIRVGRLQDSVDERHRYAAVGRTTAHEDHRGQYILYIIMNYLFTVSRFRYFAPNIIVAKRILDG